MGIIKFIKDLLKRLFRPRSTGMALLEDIHIDAAGDDPKAKIDSLVKQLNEWSRVLSNEDRTNLTKDDAGDNRLLIGYQDGGFENGNVGVKLSQAGNDVLTAGSDSLIFSTDFNSFKIVGTGTVTTATISTSPAAGQYGFDESEELFPHNLGYAPIVIAYQYDLAQGVFTPLPYTSAYSGSSSTAVWENFNVYVDATNFAIYQSRLSYGTSGSTGGFTIKYYLLRETAN